MSAMKFTFKKSIKGYALKDGAVVSNLQPEGINRRKDDVSKWKKGDEIPIQVYENYISSKGGGTSTTDVYVYGKSRYSSYNDASGETLRLGKDFTLDMADVPKGLDNKKTVMYLLLLAVGYIAYKQFKK